MSLEIEKIAVESTIEGLLLVDKPQGKTSFSLVRLLRKCTGVKKIGHTGTLDPFATGVMVMLLGRNFTRLSDELLCQEKIYLAQVCLGVTTDTYDCDGQVVGQSKKVPDFAELRVALDHFQGEIDQTPPMYSAKKVAGKKLYELARAGIEVERKAAKVKLSTTLLSYEYPHINLQIHCSKGTYIRCVAHELGLILGCGAHLSKLQRLQSGPFLLKDCIDGSLLENSDFDVFSHIRKSF